MYKRGYSLEIIKYNVDKQMADGVAEVVALMRATAHARSCFKMDQPDNVKFPVHLIPGQVTKAYEEFKGGEDIG